MSTGYFPVVNYSTKKPQLSPGLFLGLTYALTARSGSQTLPFAHIVLGLADRLG